MSTQDDFILKITIAIISFGLGLLSKFIIDLTIFWIKKRRIKDIFKQDFNSNWSKLDELVSAPAGNFFSRIKTSLKGVDDLTFKEIPEYNYPIWTYEVFKEHGKDLLKHINRKKRKKYWEIYSILSDIEQTRKILISIDKSAKDYTQYQKLFSLLIFKVRKEYNLFIDSL